MKEYQFGDDQTRINTERMGPGRIHYENSPRERMDPGMQRMDPRMERMSPESMRRYEHVSLQGRMVPGIEKKGSETERMVPGIDGLDFKRERENTLFQAVSTIRFNHTNNEAR